MSLHHYPYQAANGRWHAVYDIPKYVGVMHSVCDCLTEGQAKSVCNTENKRQAQLAAAAAVAATHPADRKIPAGFYTDRDAT